MDYFPHDTQALSDDKLLALRLKHGGEAVYCYWSLLEKIYSDEAPFDMSETNVEATSVLYRLGVGSDVLKTYVSTMVNLGLFFWVDDTQNVVMSERAAQHIEQLDKKRIIARQNGKKRSQKTTKKPTGNQQGTNVGTNVEPTLATNKTLNIKHIKKDIPKGISKEKFKKPTPQEVKEYANERGCNDFDGEQFCDFYESKGWKVGSNPMKDWKAAVRTWLKRDGRGGSVDYSQYDIR